MMTSNTYQNQGQASQQPILSGYSSGMQTVGQQYYGQQTSGQWAGSQQGAGATASQAVIGVFQSRRQAEEAIQTLRQQGFTSEEISVVTKKDKQGGGKDDRQGREYVEDDVTDGALTGGTLGGIGGLILGAGALAIPGVGPIIAAGPIAAALGGAVAGGVAGGLIDWGIPAEVSHRYEQHVAQGGILAVVHTDAQKVERAAQILRQNGATDVEAHKTQDEQRKGG